MKKFGKWFLIILGSLLLIATVIVAAVFVSHDRYGLYFTGGKISDLQSKYDAVFYDINLEINSKEQSIGGFVNVGIRPLVDDLRIIELDLINNFDVEKVEWRNEALNFKHENDKLLISLAKPAVKDQYAEFLIKYSGQPLEAIKPPWIGGFNWSKDKNGDDWIGVSCQGEGGQIWFPCKTHPSDEPDSVSINITVPEPYCCASNGILENISTPKEGFKTFHWFTGYPTNNYNISINIAKYEILEKSYTSIKGTEIPVVYYYLNDSKEMADSLVDMAIDMLQTFEKYFGEYPFADEKFGLAETSYYGMEHQTINSYGNRYRFTERDNFKFDILMLHEMSHEWWGNKVTVKDWADFWIHEGIGTYSEAVYLLDKLGEKGYHDHMSTKRRAIKNKAPILKPKNAKSSEAYSGDIYSKGAYFIHSLRYMLGDSIFFSSLYQFANEPEYTYKNLVDTDNFLDLINKNSGKDYSAFFNFCLRTTNLFDVKIDSLGQNKWNISIPSIDFELPMELEINGNRDKFILGPQPITIESETKVLVDPKNWYLHTRDFN